MKVFLMVPEMNFGGVEEGTFDLATGMKKMGVDVAVISGPGTYIPLLEQANIKWFNLPTNRKTPAVFFRSLKKLKEILEIEKPHILHCRSRFPAWIAYFALSENRKTKFVTSIHGFYRCPPYSRILAKGERVIAISDTLARFAIKKLGANPDSVRIIHNGIQFDPYINIVPEKHSGFIVGGIGRLTKLKGFQNLILAIALAKKSLPDIELWIVGDGPYKKHLEALSYKLKVNAKFLKGKSHQFLSRMDILVAPHTETETIETGTTSWLGRVVYEAELAGVPVISTLNGLPKNQFTKTDTELLVLPDDIEAMSKAIVYAAHHPDEMKIMVSNAKKFVIEHFSIQQMIRKTISVYQEIL